MKPSFALATPSKTLSLPPTPNRSIPLHRRAPWLVATTLILLGFTPGMRHLISLLPGHDGAFGNIALLVFALALAPLLPLTIVLIRIARRPLHPTTATVFCILTLMLGTFFTLATAAFTGAGTLITLIHGTALTLATAATFIGAASHRMRPITTIAITLPTLAAVWSLASIPFTLASAHRIAAGAPFCIARHDAPGAITSLWDLRAFTFYTTASGYKDSSLWYFHGLLIAQRPAGPAYYNWSPRLLRFDPILRPADLNVPPMGACQPI
jgi:hypothetical protein